MVETHKVCSGCSAEERETGEEDASDGCSIDLDCCFSYSVVAFEPSVETLTVCGECPAGKRELEGEDFCGGCSTELDGFFSYSIVFESLDARLVVMDTVRGGCSTGVRELKEEDVGSGCSIGGGIKLVTVEVEWGSEVSDGRIWLTGVCSETFG